MRGVMALVTALILFGCSDAEQINARFASSQASWYRFGAHQLQKVFSPQAPWDGHWQPYETALRVTDLYSDGETAYAAASGAGLVTVSDPDGVPRVEEASSRRNLRHLRTGLVFPFDSRVFVTLYQEPHAFVKAGLPITLAWLDSRSQLVFYPVPYQVSHPEAQAVTAVWDASQGVLHFVWKEWQQNHWSWTQSALTLQNGQESGVTSGWPAPAAVPPLPESWHPLWVQLAQRNPSLGSTAHIRLLGQVTQTYQWSPAPGAPSKPGVVSATAWPDGSRLAVTEDGVVAFDSPRSGLKLFHLYPLGVAGRYTGAVALKHGVVLSWDTFYRSYTGPAGILYLPLSRFLY
ncbi:MAG: hypothetical protein HKM05_09640 [Spirochaetales bacterium]|nr:hypothetical protein [Spirochaetales bacterium]